MAELPSRLVALPRELQHVIMTLSDCARTVTAARATCRALRLAGFSLGLNLHSLASEAESERLFIGRVLSRSFTMRALLACDGAQKELHDDAFMEQVSALRGYAHLRELDEAFSVLDVGCRIVNALLPEILDRFYTPYEALSFLFALAVLCSNGDHQGTFWAFTLDDEVVEEENQWEFVLDEASSAFQTLDFHLESPNDLIQIFASNEMRRLVHTLRAAMMPTQAPTGM